jgi:FkbM family methyltransferase
MLPRVNLVSTEQGRYLLFANNDVINNTLYREGRWEPQTLQVAKALLSRAKPDGVVLDAGANLGAFTIPMAEHCRGQHAVVSVEPQRLVYYQLCGSIVANSLDNVYALNLALGKECKKLNLPVPDYNREFNIGGLTVDPEIRRLRGQAGRFTLSDFHNAGTEWVDMVTVDSLNLTDLALIKLDVEGVELDVLNGAVETLMTSDFPPILFEVWDDKLLPSLIEHKNELLTFVKDLGYEIQAFGDLAIAQNRLHGPIVAFESRSDDASARVA